MPDFTVWFIREGGTWRASGQRSTTDSGLDRDLVWGPEDAVEFADALPPIEFEPPDFPFLNNGVAVDLDNHVLLANGGTDTKWQVPPRRIWMRLMAATWPGWALRWAHYQADDFVDYLGLGGHVAYEEPRVKETSGLYITEEIGLVNQVISLSSKGETHCAASQISGVPNLLVHGSAEVLSALVAAPPTLSLPEVPWSGGTHIDVDQHCVLFWWSGWQMNRRSLELVRDAWPGWTVTPLGDSYEDHVRLARGALHFGPLDERALTAALIHHLLNPPENDLEDVDESRLTAGLPSRAARRDVRERVLSKALSAAGLPKVIGSTTDS